VFPLLDNPLDEDDADAEAHGNDGTTLSAAHSTTLTNSLSNFPSWLSMPSLPLASTTEALMAIDRGAGAGNNNLSTQQKYERLRRTADSEFLGVHHTEDGSQVEMARDRVRVVRSPPPRPRSYHQILEDFEVGAGVITSPVQEDEEEDGDDQYPSVVDLGDAGGRNEDTARRNKRFSLPAVALHTTSVTARTDGSNMRQHYRDREGRAPGRAKRFSLVLGTRPTHLPKSQSDGGRIEEGHEGAEEGHGLGKGIAAGKLSELLGRQRTV
jgi:hypothetical protein